MGPGPVPISLKETLKIGPILFPRPRRAFFRAKEPVLTGFWAFWVAPEALPPILGAVPPQAASKAGLAIIRLARAKEHLMLGGHSS